jgi:alpha-D-ribose 1-methylphosphonate 5-triphosphate synthase subunit PhnG
MAVLARASAAELRVLLEDVPELPPLTRLRGPESGLVMVRGRMGGGGDAFNLGEMTVTRCSVSLEDGTIGHAYVTGRDGLQAELAASVDAALQNPQLRPALMQRVIAPLREAQRAARGALASHAAATQVQFFTMATMRT